jgi:hypothetical protein
LVDAGLFHDFHQSWSVKLCDALNMGVLSDEYFALIEQKTPKEEPDVLALKLARSEDEPARDDGALAVAMVPPKTRITRRSEETHYAAKANRITVRHRHGDVVAIVEFVSPGNKSSKAAFRLFVQKAVKYILAGVSVLIVDVFPPTKRDPFGVHKAIWDEFEEEDFSFPKGKTRTLVSYDAGPPQVAYIENVGVGDALPDMPIFLRPEFYVNAPLESTYQTAWEAFPKALKGLLEPAQTKKRK